MSTNTCAKVVLAMAVLLVHGRSASGDSDEIVFPGETNFREVRARSGGRMPETPDPQDYNQIPLELIQKLNEAEDVSEVLLNYVEGDVQDLNIFQLSNRFSGGSERAAASLAKPARCMPMPQPVELRPPANDSRVMYIPQCTRVQRCGGCCSHSLLSCQPTLTETLSFQVMVTRYTGGTKLQLDGKEIVLVEQHLKCKCDCAIKAEDCNIFQQYKKEECRCLCTNLDEKKKCEKYNETKLWDPKICKCRCREMGECTTGSVFDQNKCTCVRIPVRRRFAELHSSKERPFTDDERYEVDTMLVLPLSKPRRKSITVS